MIHDGLACCWCPAHRFPTRQALADHEAEHRAAERAAITADPLAVLRQALVWAADEDRLRLIAAEFRPLLEPARLRPGKPSPRFPAALNGSHDGVNVRARITADGCELHVQVDCPALRLSQRTRVHLPAEFAMTAPRPPQLRDSRVMMERYHEQRERGVEAERQETRQ